MRNIYKRIKIKYIAAFLFAAFLISQNLYSQVNEQWIHRYTGPEASTDTPTRFFIDAGGNFFVTGRTLIGGGYYHIVTVKFNSTGVRQWVAKYISAVNQNDDGVSVQVDQNGNVYVAGTTRKTSGQFDVILLKYNSSGIQQWIQQYNGTGNSDDFASECAVDNSGNIYVGGYTYSAGTAYNFLILKYNSSGVQQWVKTWNSPSNSDDLLKKISLTQNNEIIVSGYSYSPSASNDFVTQKYDVSGNLIWSQNYNGPLSLDDQVIDMKIDLSDNIYITGKSKGVGVGYDYATVKYNSAGAQQWVSRFNNAVSNDDVPSTLTVDNSGNVIVTGYSNFVTNYQDYLTVKYNSAGAQQWFAVYDGEDHYFDKAADVKTDLSGNVYVTGKSLKLSDGTSDAVSIKYNSNGTQVWKDIYNGPGNLDDDPLQMEFSGNSLYILSISSSYFFSPFCGTSDYLTLNYNLNGTVNWETRYDGSGSGNDFSSDIALDNNGNCYVTGYSYDRFTLFDYATIKYNAAGVPLWVSRYDGNYNVDKANSIALDNAGNVYVTGSSTGTTGVDIATVKYNSAGEEMWASRYNGPAGGEDVGVKVSVDVSGNIIVSGYSEGAGSGKDYVTIKYNSSGVQQWASRYNGPGNSDDFINSMTLDSSGNIFITGKSNGIGTLEDIATVKYNSTGTEQWVSRYNGVSNNSDIGNSIIIDASGNIIVNGISKSAAVSDNHDSQIANFDIITLKYNSSGTQQWVALYNGNENGDDEAGGIVSDNAGNIYIAGSSRNSGTNLDFTTIKYNPSGSVIWTAFYNGNMNSNDKASSISKDALGNLYVTGYCTDNISNESYLTVKYNNDGIFKWQKKYNYIDNDSDKAGAIKTDNQGNVYVTGTSKSSEGGFDYTTIKYNQYKSLELVSLLEGRYNEVSNEMVPDSAKVFLRNSSSPYNIVDSSIAVIDSSGKGIFFFKNASNNTSYYIVLIHKNSIDTWSSAGLSFVSSELSYNFSDSKSKAYGNNQKQKGSRFCIFTGDGNKDDVIDAADVAGVENESSTTFKGWSQWDMNGDFIVDASDLSIVENNTVDFTEVIRP